jgi:hypothetical protein
MPIIRQPLFEGSDIERLILIDPGSSQYLNLRNFLSETDMGDKIQNFAVPEHVAFTFM